MTGIVLVGLLLLVVLATPALVVELGFLTHALWTGVRLPDPPPDAKPDRRWAHAARLFGREWLSTLRVLLAWPLGLGNGKPRLDERTDRRPLLLVPGYGLTRSSLWPLQNYLAGHRIVADAWTPPLFAPPRTAAARLVVRLRALSEAAADRPVDVVAFGGGGLLLGEALAADPEVPLGRVVSLGTPWKGSPASVFWPGGGAPPMLPHRPDLTYWNELLDTVLGQPIDGVEDRRVAITSAADLWVPAPFNAAPDGVKEVRLHGVGHLHLLHAPSAAEAVREALTP